MHSQCVHRGAEQGQASLFTQCEDLESYHLISDTIGAPFLSGKYVAATMVSFSKKVYNSDLYVFTL